MKKKISGAVIGVIVVIAIIVIIVISLNGPTPQQMPINNPVNSSPTPTQTNQTPPANPAQTSDSGRPPITTTVDIANFAFSQSNLNLHIGDRVVWTNFDTTQHTVTSDSGGTELNSDPISKGQSYAHTFNTVGTFKYHCKFHPNMQATIIIS